MTVRDFLSLVFLSQTVAHKKYVKKYVVSARARRNVKQRRDS